MNRRSFFKFLGIGAAAAPVAVEAVTAAPVTVPTVPVVPSVPAGFTLPQGCYGTFSITMRLPEKPGIHNWGAGAGRPYKGSPEFYRDRHARKHGW